ncbi:hypothetical protein [Sporomusa aerivorans]|uniref:hypothetical protein n=1 Tax=Sporomusa aerivorans TaxID=204936 RepID=UPI003529D85B
MINSVAILLDAGFVLKKMEAELGRIPTSQEIYEFSLLCVKPDEQLSKVSYL